MTLFDLLAVAMARYYLFHMPPSSPLAGAPWSWLYYDCALCIFRDYLDLSDLECFPEAYIPEWWV